MSHKGFSHVGLSTLDLDRTREFYEKVLGFKVHLNLGSERDWNFVGQPNPHLNSRSIPLNMGKVLGGGSSINVMAWARGFIRDAAATHHHQTCTAKMGRDAMSVVDNHLKVYGIDNLRIADGSVMPRVTTGNTMAPCVIIGKRAAEIVKAEHHLLFSFSAPPCRSRIPLKCEN